MKQYMTCTIARRLALAAVFFMAAVFLPIPARAVAAEAAASPEAAAPSAGAPAAPQAAESAEAHAPATAAHAPETPPPAPPAAAPGHASEVRETPSEPVAAEAAAVASAAAGSAVALPTADEAKAAAAAADAEAERLAAEVKAKRERESYEMLREAEDFVATADQWVSGLPYPVNLLFSESVFGIPLWRYTVAIAVGFVCVFLLYMFLRHVRKVGAALETGDAGANWRRAAQVVVVSLRNPAKIILPALLLRACSHMLVTSYHPDIVWISKLLIFLGGTLFLFDLVGVVDRVYGDRIFHSDSRLMDTVRPTILIIVRLLIVAVAGMHIYEGVTGQTMFSVLAGLGLGGLALALASQETLKNLLGFASIAFDKTFLVGDPVTIANYDGVVEHIGMRSLQLRTYNGNRVIIPNATAINSNIVNLSRRPYIRREILIALSTLNPYEKIEEAINLIRETVETHQGKLPGKPPTVRFSDFEPARFIIQVMFWYDATLPDYYDECSRVNLEICKRLSRAGVIYAER